MIIGISGRKGSGKSTVARCLHRRIEGAMILPFAFTIKQIAQECFGAQMLHVDGTESQKNLVMDCGLTGREVMQRIGSSMRNIWQDAFVYAWEGEVVGRWAEMGAIPVIVPDVRFRNEVKKIKTMGGVVIRLNRMPFPDNHESETELDSFRDWDLLVNNAELTEEETCAVILEFCREKGIV